MVTDDIGRICVGFGPRVHKSNCGELPIFRKHLQLDTWSTLLAKWVLAGRRSRNYDKPNFGVFFNWLFMMTFVMISSYLFYLLIEYPGHLAARHAGKTLEGDQGKSANNPLPRSGEASVLEVENLSSPPAER